MGFFEETDAAKKNRSDPSWLNEAHHEPTAAYREIERMMSQLEVGPSSAGRGNRTPIPERVLIRPPGAKPDTAHDFKLERYYPGKKDHHEWVTTERPHPTGGSCPREGHGKGS